MHKRNSWVVLADGGEARFYEQWYPDGDLHLVDFWMAPYASPRHVSRRDRHGLGVEGADTARHMIEPLHDPQEAAKTTSAKRICQHLDKMVEAGRAEDLILVAPPRFLGELRHHLGKRARSVVRAEIPKDLIKVPLREVTELLNAVI